MNILKTLKSKGKSFILSTREALLLYHSFNCAVNSKNYRSHCWVGVQIHQCCRGKCWSQTITAFLPFTGCWRHFLPFIFKNNFENKNFYFDSEWFSILVAPHYLPSAISQKRTLFSLLCHQMFSHLLILWIYLY